MGNITAVGKGVCIAFQRWMGSKRSVLILFITVLFGIFMYLPLVEGARLFHETVPPVGFVFFFSFFTMQVLYGGVCTLLYSDVLTMDEYTLWSIQRIGKRNYMLSCCLYVLVMAGLYTLLQTAVSFLVLLPVRGPLSDWGKILRTMSSDPMVILNRISHTSNIGVSTRIIRNLTPVSALGFTMLLVWLVTAFMGMLQLFFTVWFGRMSGIAACGFCIGMSVFALFLGRLSLGEWLLYLSPLSWTNIDLLEWSGTGQLPSPVYAVLFLSFGLLLMGVLGVIRFAGKDTV